MGEYKTPGVYIKEKNAFGNSVVEAETAIPAFIGITNKAQNGNDNLTGIPWKISSMTEYLQYFGGEPELEFSVDIKKFFYLSEMQKAESVSPKKTLSNTLTEPAAGIFKYCVRPEGETEDTPVGYALCVDGDNKYTLYYNMLLFFANGGSTCYVVSVGSHGGGSKDTLTDTKVDAALKALEKIQEVTMIIVPEAVENTDCCANIQQLMLKHCGEMANRFTILDIPPKYPANEPLKTRMETFQGSIGSSYLSYGAAYFPWLNTSVLGDRDLSGNMFTWSDNVYTWIEKFADPAFVEIVKMFCKEHEDVLEIKADDEVVQTVNGHTFKFAELIKDEKDVYEGESYYIYADDDKSKTKILGKIKKVEEIKEGEEKVTSKKIKVVWNPSFKYVEDKQTFHQALYNASKLYQQAMKAVLKYLNLLPTSAAMAGIYTMVDNNRGVWKAPANVTLSYVDSITEDLDDDQQAGLNAPMNGKAINVIRSFQGEGTKVWGARTLDGNSLDWRYINVRRTLLFLEESVKNAARAYVFEPNEAGTWINMRCMIENFLRSVWKRGGLAGATPEDAFEVHVGLGDTMTGEDILEGIMRITVLVAITHPAEFIEITFQQQMQKS